MKIITKNEAEAITVADALTKAASSIRQSMTISELEQATLSMFFNAMRDSVEVEDA